jgi:hypothetical protein
MRQSLLQRRLRGCARLTQVDDRYEVKKKIGQGAYGLICAATDRQNGETVAVKKIANAFEDAIDCKRTLREIRLLQHFNHENVLNLRDIMLPPPGSLDQWNDIYLALELMDTDLHYIIHSKQALTDDHIQYFIYQILRGLKAIHSAKVRAASSPRKTALPSCLSPLRGARAGATRAHARGRLRAATAGGLAASGAAAYGGGGGGAQLQLHPTIVSRRGCDGVGRASTHARDGRSPRGGRCCTAT